MAEQTTNNQYFKDLAGVPRDSPLTNNQLIAIIASKGGAGGGLTPEQLEALNSATEKITEQQITIESIQEKDSSQDASISDLNSRVNGASTTVTNLSTRVGVLEDNYVDYAPTIQDIQSKDTSQDTLISAATSKNEEQDLRLDAMETVSTSHENRVTTLESTITNKADLVSGKIPLNQLPDLPVGRKVSVANQAERLALDSHPDLTIAYQIDTADAWVLDSNEDPSVESNWDKLGNAQGTGVQSFKGRTGNVEPQSGDYTSAMITTSTDRSFISETDRTRWDDKATPAQVTASTSALRSEVVAGYIPTSQRSAVNGVASLGSDGKVPLIQLPPIGLTTQQSARLDEIESIALIADAKGDSAATNILAVDNRLTQVDTDSKSRDAGKANTVHTHAISDVSDLQTSLNSKQNTLVSGTSIKTINNQSILGSGNINVNEFISSSVVNNVTVTEFGNRTEYQCKIPFTATIPSGAARFTTQTSNRILPAGITINGADEHYISVRNNERSSTVAVWDNASRQIVVGLGNTWDGTVTTTGTVFVKLVYYK